MGLTDIILLDDDINDIDLFISLFGNFNIANPVRYFLTLDEFEKYFSDIDENNLPLLSFIDIKILDRDGLDAVRMMKRHELTKDLKIVVLTGLSDESTILKALEAGADAYSVKPVTNEDILGYIRKFDLSIFLSDKIK